MTTIEHPAAVAGNKIVVVIGAGFAGLNAVKVLANKPSVQVVLIDQRNHHLFQPLLYQVATAGLNPSDIAVPIRALFAKADNVEVHMARIHAIDLNRREVAIGEIFLRYDYLVLACGSQHSYFEHPEWEEFAPGLKSVEQALEIRRRILLAFEDAENEPDDARQSELMTFVVVGGGPTGVELAGAIADISRTVLVRDFKRINPWRAKIILIESGSRILRSFPEQLSSRAARDLQELGVEVRTGTRVELVDGEGVVVGAQRIAAKSVFWAAGVQATALGTTPDLETDRAGRIVVGKDFSVPGYPNAYVVGDMAAFELAPDMALPGLAPGAIQAGQFVAKAIVSLIAGEQVEHFHYLDKGQMATIGKRRAIAVSGSLKLTGFIAWLAWLLVHVYSLVGTKNRASVLLQWTWGYLFSRRGSRLITERDWKLKS